MSGAIRVKDGLGVIIEIGDRVSPLSYGYALRLSDTGRTATVTGFTSRGNVLASDDNHYDPFANGKGIHPDMLGVRRRDGEKGLEGNVVYCETCGDPLDRPTGAGWRASCADAHAKEKP